MTTEIDGFDLIAPRSYGERGVPHDQWRELRRREGLHHCTPEGFDPFYPVVRHDEICEISKQPDRFLSRHGIVLESLGQKRFAAANESVARMRAIIVMDPPEHRDFRKVAVPWFTPRAIQNIAPIVEESARELVDGLDEHWLVPGEHPELQVQERPDGVVEVRYRERYYAAPREDVIVLPINNTSAENFSTWIGRELHRRLADRFPALELRDLIVRVEETQGQRGVYRFRS